MSRLTGTDAKNLMEAYSEVYASQEELTEEQIWESAEIWVYECIENGVDFSEYTLDELTEAFLIDYGYLSEDSAGRAGRDFGAGARQLFGSARRAIGTQISNTVKGAADVAGATLQGYTGTRTTSSNPLAQAGNLATRAVTAPARFGVRAAQGFVTGRGSTPPSRPASAPQRQGPPVPDRLQQRPPAAQPPRQQPPAAQPPRQQSAPARPAAPAPARPAAPAPARPAATTPAAGTQKPAPATTPAASTSTAAAPARPSLASQAAELRQMRARSLERQGKPLSAAVVSATAKPTAFQANSFDPFDVIKGHLLDEGYADTEESALAIMTNMSETWKEEILEGVLGEDKKYDRNRQRAAQRAAARNRARQEGKTGNVPGVGYVSPRPEGETYRDSAGVERHTSGARMPKKDS
jgi:hypothetical protein